MSITPDNLCRASIWYGVGVSISYSGPVSVLVKTEVHPDQRQVGALVCFIIMGINIFFVMQCIGELATLYPSAGAFTEHCGRFVDGAVAVSLGWNYWYLVSTVCIFTPTGSHE
jgi:yeast amino acid transporter